MSINMENHKRPKLLTSAAELAINGMDVNKTTWRAPVNVDTESDDVTEKCVCCSMASLPAGGVDNILLCTDSYKVKTLLFFLKNCLIVHECL